MIPRLTLRNPKTGETFEFRSGTELIWGEHTCDVVFEPSCTLEPLAAGSTSGYATITAHVSRMRQTEPEPDPRADGRPVYAFDIDGVLCDTEAALRASIEAELGVTLKRGGAYDTFGFLHDDPEVMAYLREHAMTHWNKRSVLDAGVPSGVDVLNALALEGRLGGWVSRRVRTERMHDATVSWLRRHEYPCFPHHQIMGSVSPSLPPIDADEAWFEDRRRRRREAFEARHDLTRPRPRGYPAFHLMNEEWVSKAAAARWMGATHLVEDSGREARMAAEDGLDVVVLRRDYNRELEVLVQAQLADLSDATPAWCRRVSFIDRLEDLL